MTCSGQVACPACGGPATVSLVERGEGHVVRFDCGNRCPAPDDATVLCLWAAVRSAAPVSRSV